MNNAVNNSQSLVTENSPLIFTISILGLVQILIICDGLSFTPKLTLEIHNLSRTHHLTQGPMFD
jgi:hypothetical protein